jgi:hypothetical protein
MTGITVGTLLIANRSPLIRETDYKFNIVFISLLEPFRYYTFGLLPYGFYKLPSLRNTSMDINGRRYLSLFTAVVEGLCS